jgi:hypothetical protein
MPLFPGERSITEIRGGEAEGSYNQRFRHHGGCPPWSAPYSVVLPSKCSLSASASLRVWWTTPSR